MVARRVSGGIMLAVRLTPKSAKDEVKGIEQFGDETVLAARVRAAPESGRANQALERLVADWLNVPPSTVSVAHGGKARLKQVKLEGDSEKLIRLVADKIASN
jgi:uncharacterized protein